MRVKMACLGVRTGERQQSRTQVVAGDGRIYTVLSQRSFHKFPNGEIVASLVFGTLTAEIQINLCLYRNIFISVLTAELAIASR